ncbi:hypothetical protein [Streptomyces longwoodensis]|uniref:hypothetical protein n=1 Tax=Streptomyces longwoodensis TaxID=68231 RepID=UPI003411523C
MSAWGDLEFDEDLDDEEFDDEDVEWLYGVTNPLAGYPTPVTRRRKPYAVGREMHDVLPTL